MILGIDEVGRGSWAGPLVVGAVVLGGVEIAGLTDSKALSKKQREKIDKEIRSKAQACATGWVHAEEIDKIGLSNALKLATKLAVEQIKVPYHEIIIDGTVNFLADTNKGKYVTCLKKADLLVPCVSAASIVAKVARDNFMVEQSKIHKEYGFASNVGYGTAKHTEGIEKHGATKLHRLSFKPLKKSANIACTKATGDDAETAVAEYLVRLGHNVMARNWKTKYCEIDIVSLYKDIIYFTEVKYRKKPDQGGGLAAINTKKLRQMKFAAEMYIVSTAKHDHDLRLAVASVSGNPPEIEEFLEVQ